MSSLFTTHTNPVNVSYMLPKIRTKVGMILAGLIDFLYHPESESSAVGGMAFGLDFGVRRH